MPHVHYYLAVLIAVQRFSGRSTASDAGCLANITFKSFHDIGKQV